MKSTMTRCIRRWGLSTALDRRRCQTQIRTMREQKESSNQQQRQRCRDRFEVCHRHDQFQSSLALK